MPTSWISFGPDLEPLASESRRGAQTAPARRDGISVSGAAEEVAAKLIEASEASAGWRRLEHADRRLVYVNGSAVRFVVDETS